ncbi:MULTISPECIES: PTS sugar transporter subunit IIB [Staphylococcus]|uniref:PTS lactose transporter subunit IIB n=1 Tax=Staphylococcus chromogenes TaxID=46126 RepID=A0AAX0ZGT6_STACR|nr:MULTISPECIES: PTS sugar transporter subunit IIB [Staphylococcus]KDP12278.1 sugar-specific PTS component EIIB [Staphylococcus chromogenes MU 970]MBP0046494.1 PTS sugar transporter subunit IIB [Staphylococcus chromogenes]MBV5138179.1 PTS sugar transporter subunit IIB [Staphylococcus chromogenes]MBW6089197.1 PTS sugar transporter subunit IIB [Staphylococcus chromogenes]MCD9059943.1 PTS sugar transporter subunit IIB [Staphylococcus chromogenes]
MKILVVCGHGLGSSFMVEMNVQEVLKNLNIEQEIEVEHSDIMTASPEMADLFICGRDLEENAARLGEVLILDNILDKQELEEKLTDKLRDLDKI